MSKEAPITYQTFQILNQHALSVRKLDISSQITQFTSKSCQRQKTKRNLTFKKANLTTWGEEDVDSSEEEKKNEEAPPYFIALNSEFDKVYDSNLSYSGDEMIQMICILNCMTHQLRQRRI